MLKLQWFDATRILFMFVLRRCTLFTENDSNSHSTVPGDTLKTFEHRRVEIIQQYLTSSGTYTQYGRVR